MFRVLRKRWLTIFLITVFFVCWALFYLSVATKLFSASSLLEMSVRRPRISAQQGAVIEDPVAGYQSEEVFNTRLEKIKSKTMSDAAFKYYITKSHRLGSAEEMDKLNALFEKKVKFTLLRRTRLIKIEFEHSDPRFAADVCNAFAETAEAGAFDENRTTSDSAVAWLQNQAAIKKKELDRIDEQFMKFRQDNKMDVLESQRKVVEDSMLTFNKALVAIESEEAKAKDLYKALMLIDLGVSTDRISLLDDKNSVTEKWLKASVERDALLTKYPANHPLVVAKAKDVKMYEAQVGTLLAVARQAATSNLNDRVGDLRENKGAGPDSFGFKPEDIGKLPAETPRAEEIKSAVEKWMAAVADHESLLTRYTSKHPEVEAKAKIVAMYRTQVQEVLGRARETAGSNLKLLGDQAASLQKKKAEQSALASEYEFRIVDCKTKQSALQRESDACEVSYKGILNRIEEARLAADENTATIKIVERAGIPAKPFKPRQTVVIFAGLAFGLLCGLGFVLVSDTLEDHITGIRDIEMYTGMKVLAVIPHIKRHKRIDIAKAALNEKLGNIAEVFAGLRTSLDSAQYRNSSKVVLICSSVPEEGKTITACNLAITLAKTKQKVLLVDFDMRRPRIMNIFPIPAGNKGLLNMLITDASESHDYSELVYETECQNLSVIASRVVHGASPAEAIGSQNVVDLIEWARVHFDRVILDAPPLGLVSDALVLAGLADCVLLVSRSDLSRKRDVCFSVRRFKDAGVNMIAAVVNDVKYFDASQYHGSSYHYYHSYGSYGDTSNGKKS